MKNNFRNNICLTFFLIIAVCNFTRSQGFDDELSEDKLTVSFNYHNASLTEKETKNVTINIKGYCENDTLLYFQFIKKNIFEKLENITLKEGEVNETRMIHLVPKHVGHSTVFLNSTPANMADLKDAYVVVSVSHNEALVYLSDVVGWLYFFAWSFSFYPQTYLNWKRKSVIGLHFDFLALNTLGFLVYSIFNVGLHWIPAIINQYFNRHPYGLNPVQLNDVIFSLHAFVACIIQVNIQRFLKNS